MTMTLTTDDTLGTNDLLVSDIIRSNEPQVWFIGEHLAATALQRAD